MTALAGLRLRAMALGDIVATPERGTSNIGA